MPMLLNNVSDKLWYHFCRLIKMKTGAKKNFAVQFALAQMILNQEVITDEKFELMRKRLDEFYKQETKMLRELSDKGGV